MALQKLWWTTWLQLRTGDRAGLARLAIWWPKPSKQKQAKGRAKQAGKALMYMYVRDPW